MKLPIQQLAQHLTKKLASIYIVSGDEPLLVQETLDQIREAAERNGFAERVRVSAETGNDWGKVFYAQTQTLSLFSSKRIVELELTTAKLTAASSKI